MELHPVRGAIPAKRQAKTVYALSRVEIIAQHSSVVLCDTHDTSILIIIDTYVHDTSIATVTICRGTIVAVKIS